MKREWEAEGGLGSGLQGGLGVPKQGGKGEPPPPHDPRERDLSMVVEGWEVRLFGGRKFQYFVTRGFWHLQLWNPRLGVSILSPSRLTLGFYEAFPIQGWKGQAPSYGALVRLLSREGVVDLPSEGAVHRLEKALVHDVVHGRTSMAS